MRNQPTNEERKRDVTRLLIFAGFIIGAIIIIYILFTVVPYILMNRPDSSDVSNEVTPRKIFHQVSLYVRSNVGGAEVHVKSGNYEERKITASTDKTANFFKLGRGKYEVRLQKEGYQEVVKQIEITGEKPFEKIQIDLTEAIP